MKNYHIGQNIDESSKVECKKCNGLGYLIYSKIIKDGNRQFKNDYACICTCENTKQYKGWEVSDSRGKTNFYTPLAQELGL